VPSPSILKIEQPGCLSAVSSNLLAYGAMHALVDAVCFGILFSIVRAQIFSETAVVYLFLFYNVLAFGLQAGLGLIVDLLRAPRAFALIGLGLTGLAAAVFTRQPWWAVAVAG
jgi:hypothetical protein